MIVYIKNNFFTKPTLYGLVHIKIEVINQDNFKFTTLQFTGQLLFLFIQKYIYNGHVNKMKKRKTKIHITVIRFKATITSEIKLKGEQSENYWIRNGF